MHTANFGMGVPFDRNLQKYINLTRNSSFIKDLFARTGLPLTSYFLGYEDISKMLSHRF